MQTTELVCGLHPILFQEALSTATVLRDLLRSLHEQLGEDAMSQLADECDRLVRRLQGPANDAIPSPPLGARLKIVEPGERGNAKAGG